MTKFCPIRINESLFKGIANVPHYIDGEYIWSYLGRLANDNGISNTVDLLSLVFNEMLIGFKGLSDYLGFTEVGEPLLSSKSCTLNTSTAFLSDVDISYLLESYFYDGTTRMNMKEWLKSKGTMKICPECFHEESQDGTWHYHTMHQLPGLNVCPLHCVPLKKVSSILGREISEPSFSDLDVADYDVSTAKFMHDLYECGFNSNRATTVKAVLEVLCNRYDCQTKKEVITNLMDD